MTAADPPTRTLGWWAVAYAAFVTPIDFSTIGLASDSGIDLLKWVLRTPVWFLPLALIAPRWPGLQSAFRRAPTSWVLSWALVAMVSVTWSITPDQSVLLGLGIGGLVVLAIWYVSVSGWDRFASAVLVGTASVTLAGLAADAADGVLVDGRSAGLTAGPTTQSGLAATALVLSAGFLFRHRLRLVSIAAVSVSLPALVFAETRTPAVAGGVALLYGATQRLGREHRLVVAVCVFALSTALVLVAGTSSLARESEDGDVTSLTGRPAIWSIALERIEDRPLLGYGVGSDAVLYDEAAREGRISFLAGHAHMLPLAAATASGVVGASLILVGLGSALRRRHEVDGWVMAPLLLVMITGATEAIVHQPTVGVLVIAGTAAAVAQPGHTGAADYRSKAPMSGARPRVRLTPRMSSATSATGRPASTAGEPAANR